MVNNKETNYLSWFQKADEDELSISAILKNNGAYSTVCFLSQQMAEKYLKAILIHHQGELPKIHALDRLLELCTAIEPDMLVLRDDAIFLTDFYIDTRYPGNYYDFSWSDAKQALTAAERIKTTCLKALQKVK